MTTILCIETSGRTCSVALSTDGTMVFEKSDSCGQAHSRLLHPFIQDALDQAKSLGLRLNAVAVSAGPGSYTGLRIGVSAAKGLCYALDIPLLTISTLELLAFTALPRIADTNALLCPMIDARRMEVYTAMYDKQLQIHSPLAAVVIDEHSFEDTLASSFVCFFGSGAEKCKRVFTSSHAMFLDDIDTEARNMCVPAQKRWEEKQNVDIAYFEPHYLKDFVASRPRNKVLGQSER